MAGRISGFVALTRPVNGLIAFLSILLGAAVTGTVHPLWRVLLAGVSGALVGAGGNAINDAYDVEIDRVNKPWRPIPSGRVSRREAFGFALALLGAGVLVALAIGWAAVLVAVVASLFLVLYSARLKRTVLWGNLSVSLVSALAFIYGGLAVRRVKEALIPAGFAFLFHLGREVVKDVEDLRGDRAGAARTLPVVHGVRAAQVFVTLVFVFLVVATWLPYLVGVYDTDYFWTVVLGVDTVLAYVVWAFWKSTEPSHLARLSNLLKADMLVGLLAIYLGR